MKGYYPISEYARLAGVSRDTAYHRAYRGEVPSKWENERLLIYYDPNAWKSPEGFVSVRGWAELHGVTHGATQAAILKKRFREEDVRRIRGRVYIRADADYERRPGGKQDTYCKKICPDGYLPCREWAKRNGMLPETASCYAFAGRIPTIMVGKYRFVREDYKYESPFTGGYRGRGCTDGAGGGAS